MPKHAINESAARGDVEVVRRLLDGGEVVGNRDQYDETPLHRAAWEGHLDVVALLVERGADVNARAGAGKTPLHRAARQDHADILRLLLACGADPHATTDSGDTPLHWAAFSGAMTATDILLYHGADPRRRMAGQPYERARTTRSRTVPVHPSRHPAGAREQRLMGLAIHRSGIEPGDRYSRRRHARQPQNGVDELLDGERFGQESDPRS